MNVILLDDRRAPHPDRAERLRAQDRSQPISTLEMQRLMRRCHHQRKRRRTKP
jgi:hypothetical protein